VKTVKRLFALTIALVYRGLRPRSATPTVLTYHSVGAQELEAFTAQMRELRAHARVAFADDVAPPNGRPAVAVTFDDALETVFDGALPVMAAEQIPATIFVPTGYLGREARWLSVKGAENRPVGRVAAAARLKALDPGLVRLGSHTVSHPRLVSLDAIALDRELASSRQALEELTGAPVTMLSLPYGLYDARVLETARASGYDRVFANVPVGAAGSGTGVLRGRINVSPRDWPLEFRLKASGAYDWLVLAMPIKRVLLRPFRKSKQVER
jgi:peptidoglycan/xylan/chitin deacetylase (PgdA/CDA1 family)